MRPILKSLGLVCAAALLAACGGDSGSTRLKGEIVEKVQNPEGRVAATTTRESGTDETPPRYHVYVERSREPAQVVEVLETDRSEVPRIRWLGPSGLEISVACGQIHRFSNFADVWSSGEDKQKAEQVVVLLDNRGVCPANAPATSASPPAQ